MIELTERLLSDAGGWQVLKQARSLFELGRVAESKWEPPFLTGRVREGEKEYRAGLRIVSKTNIENLCSCRDSRQRGLICPHSIAIGLAVLKPAPAQKPATPPASAQSTAGANPNLEIPIKFADEPSAPLLELAFVFSPQFEAAWERGSVTVGLEVLILGKRSLLGGIDLKQPYRASNQDRFLIEQLIRFADGSVPAMLSLDAEGFVSLLSLITEHPRVSFGRDRSASVSRQTINAEVAGKDRRLTGRTQSWILRGNVFHKLESQPASARANVATSGPQSTAQVSFQLRLEGSLNYLEGELQAITNAQATTISARSTITGPIEAAVSRLQAEGFAGPNNNAKFVLKGESRILAFFATGLPALQRSWKVEIGSRFENVTSEIERIQPQLEIRSSGENWFEMTVDLATGAGERFSASEIQRLLQSGQNSIRLKNRKIAVFDSGLLEEFQQVLADCNPQQPQPGLYRINQNHAAYLQGIAESRHLTVAGTEGWKVPQKLSELKPIPLGSLEPILREYQKQGVYWLNYLKMNGWCGVLADEMGLGKTLQALAFLRTLPRPNLIVCPSSLVFNWQREAQRFVPERKVLVLQGPDRARRFKEIAEADLILTSYPLLRRDIEAYRRLEFQGVVLDEAHHIKNPDSQSAQAAHALKAKQRVILTGTPIENSVRDLWSAMHFLMPGYLGSRKDFQERYEAPIRDNPGGPEQQRLIQRMRPFMMRRTKRQVASELPEKLEQVAYVELTPSQQKYYNELLTATRRQLGEAIPGKNASKGRMLVLTALLRLRQACCDARLLGAKEDEESSAKLELLEELLEECMEDDHRVLVFSQFTSMLQLIRERLDSRSIEYCYLDGQTKDREDVVGRFQAGNVPVFLISLKAGGVGLNLTAADTVVHFDPWWNPAVEAQATDRAHRIGQTRIVTSYKLVARGTIEEKILQLQTRKKDVAAAVLESEEPMMEGLTFEEIEQLLEA